MQFYLGVVHGVLFSQVELDVLEQSWQTKWQMHRMVLMVKDAMTLFAYWEIGDGQKSLLCQHFTRTWNEFSFFLRLHDVTDRLFDGYHTNETRSSSLHPAADHWYFHDVQPQRDYIADVCTQTEENHSFAIVQSAVVQTPPALCELDTDRTTIRFVRPHASHQKLREIFDADARIHYATQHREKVPLFREFDGYTVLGDS